MIITGVIPARYNSTRFPGKPLADICGHPMIYWVYRQAKKVKKFNSVLVAADDERIAEQCKKNDIEYIMTSGDIPNHIHRIWQVSENIKSDYYVSINGDEPLIDPASIEKILPEQPISEQPYFGSAYRELEDPAEVLDIANVKIVLDRERRCLYQSRHPIPSTKGSLMFKYKKAIGIECFNKLALDFFVNTNRGSLEKIEDIDHLRFIENGVPIWYTRVDSDSISVDTQHDLEKVIIMMKKKLH